MEGIFGDFTECRYNTTYLLPVYLQQMLLIAEENPVHDSMQKEYSRQLCYEPPDTVVDHRLTGRRRFSLLKHDFG